LSRCRVTAHQPVGRAGVQRPGDLGRVHGAIHGRPDAAERGQALAEAVAQGGGAARQVAVAAGGDVAADARAGGQVAVRLLTRPHELVGGHAGVVVSAHGLDKALVLVESWRVGGND